MMNKKKKLIKNIVNGWLPVILWALVIFSFSAKPTEQVSEVHWQDFVFKKTIHIIEYAIFSLLLYRAFRKSERKKKDALLMSFWLSVLYGITDEIHQSFTPGREPTVRDVFFDTIGAGISIYFVSNLLPRSSQRVQNVGKKLNII